MSPKQQISKSSNKNWTVCDCAKTSYHAICYSGILFIILKHKHTIYNQSRIMSTTPPESKQKFQDTKGVKWSKEGQKDKQRSILLLLLLLLLVYIKSSFTEDYLIYKALHRKPKIKQQQKPRKIGCEFKCSGMVCSSCSTCDTRHNYQIQNCTCIFYSMILC